MLKILGVKLFRFAVKPKRPLRLQIWFCDTLI